MTRGTAERTARERLSSLRAEASRILRRVLDRHDVSQAALADACGTTPQKVQLWCEPQSPQGPSVAHLALMPREVVADVLAPLLEPLRLLIVDRPEAGACEGDHLRKLHRITAECGDVQREYMLALASGGVDDAEARRLEREIDEAVMALLSAREHLRRQRGAEVVS